MKTTIIDILNKIANNEQPPKKIIFKDEIYEYDEKDGDYRNKNYEGLFDYYEIRNILNNEVIILETTITYKQDKIEKITLDDWVEFTTTKDINNIDYMFNKNSRTFVDKINEIIEAINER